MRVVIRREWLLACGAALVLAAAMIWLLPPYVLWVMSAGAIPVDVATPVGKIIGDGGDPTGQAWQIAWNGHALLHNLGGIWNTNAFYPDTYGLAFTDSLIGYAPAGLIGDGVSAAILRYNVVFVLAFALAFLGGYALSRELGANRVGAAVAGAAFAYAPWRYGHDGHLNILSTGGIALSLAMLIRGHRRNQPGWVVAGWLVAAWQITLGFGIGLAFAYILAVGCVVALIRFRKVLNRRLVLADLGGGLAFTAVTGYFAWVYEHVRDLHPEIPRTWDYVAVFSPTWRGLLTAPRTSLPWGDWHQAARDAMDNAANEKVLLCGYFLYGLAAAGMFASIWTVRRRLLLLAGVVVGVLLALGTNGPLYRILYLYVPGFDGSRTPGRLILWPTLLLALLAAGFITHLSGRMGQYAKFLTVPLLVAVLFEGMPKLDHVTIKPAPAAMVTARAPLMVLPSDEGVDLNIQLWSTEGFPTMVNGAASIVTPDHGALRDLMETFPSDASVARLRELGIHSLVVIRDRVTGTPYEQALNAPPRQGLDRQDIGPDVLYTIY